MAILTFVGLSFANLSETNLANANVQGARFKNAEFKRDWPKEIASDEHGNPNLEDVSLENVDLASEDLSNANMKGANLQGANLLNTNLTSANLVGVKKADLRLAIRGSNDDYSMVDSSCLTPSEFDRLVKEAFTNTSVIESIPLIGSESKKLLQEIINLVSQEISIQDKSGISLLMEGLAKPKSFPLLLKLLSLTRDNDGSIRNDALAIFKPASSEEIKNIANVIGQKLAKNTPEALSVFQLFSQHFSDIGSPLAEVFKDQYPIIKGYLSAEQQLLLSELLKGDNREIHARKFNGAEYCFQNPHTN